MRENIWLKAGLLAIIVTVGSTLLAAFSSLTIIQLIGTFVLSFLAYLGIEKYAASYFNKDYDNDEYLDDDDFPENDDRQHGTVKWFNVSKGFGFITCEDGEDVFVHFRNIRGRGHRSLSEGQRVKFHVRESDKGLQAEDVSIVRA